jgi:hypothetical protein
MDEKDDSHTAITELWPVFSKDAYDMTMSTARSQQLTKIIFFDDKITRKVYKEQNNSEMIGKVYKMNETLSKCFLTPCLFTNT